MDLDFSHPTYECSCHEALTELPYAVHRRLHPAVVGPVLFAPDVWTLKGVVIHLAAVRVGFHMRAIFCGGIIATAPPRR